MNYYRYEKTYKNTILYKFKFKWNLTQMCQSKMVYMCACVCSHTHAHTKHLIISQRNKYRSKSVFNPLGCSMSKRSIQHTSLFLVYLWEHHQSPYILIVTHYGSFLKNVQMMAITPICHKQNIYVLKSCLSLFVLFPPHKQVRTGT